jgi:uncharacterized protein DUF2829
MNFGEALQALKNGEQVQRAGWNGKGMWLVYVPGTPNVELLPFTPYHDALHGGRVTIDPHIDMFTRHGTMQPGWQATQADMLADDWQVV